MQVLCSAVSSPTVPEQVSQNPLLASLHGSTVSSPFSAGSIPSSPSSSLFWAKACPGSKQSALARKTQAQMIFAIKQKPNLHGQLCGPMYRETPERLCPLPEKRSLPQILLMQKPQKFEALLLRTGSNAGGKARHLCGASPQRRRSPSTETYGGLARRCAKC